MLHGFPNQVNDLAKLGRAIQVAQELSAAGRSFADDDQFGEGLVRAGVLGTGHTPRPVDEYLAEQRQKPAANQSHRASARGLREFLRMLRCIDDHQLPAIVTPLGAELARHSATAPLTSLERARWRGAMLSLRLGDPEIGVHPYRVLLRLLEARPAIDKPLLALALEAKTDSEDELARIVALSDLGDSTRIWQAIGGQANSMSNWANAVKVLPAIAIQLGDMIQIGQACARPTGPSPSPVAATEAIDTLEVREPQRRHRRAPRTVDQDSIARAGLTETLIAITEPTPPTEEELAARRALQAERLSRHNSIVREIAQSAHKGGGKLFEDPVDCLFHTGDTTYLFEIKTLDENNEDEFERVREALGQLLYYERFSCPNDLPPPQLIAVFERKISDDHIDWLKHHNITAIWKSEAGFSGQQAAVDLLGTLLPISTSG